MATLNYSTRYSDQLRAGQLVAQWNTSGSRILRYYVDFSHKGLDLHKQLSAPDIAILQNKVDVLVEAWEKKWETALVKKSETEGKDLASKLTELRSLLRATLNVDDTVNWDSLKSKAVYAQLSFDDPRPLPPAPTRPIAPPKEPEITFFDKLLGRKNKKLSAHQDAVNAVISRRKAASENYNSLYTEYKSRLAAWEEAEVSWQTNERHKEVAFNFEKAKANESIDALKDRWSAADPDAIIEHATLVLEKSNLPEIFSKNFDLAYN
jgi:restriction system protein